jgi:cystathionine beta-lyase/cystathionine gamma-synthase
MTPVYLTSTYAQAAPGDHKGYEYSRGANPTRNAMEQCLASLEGGKHGIATASGLSASTIVLNALDAGAHVLAGDDLYGGTRRLFEEVYRQHGLTFSYVDASDAGALKEALDATPPALLWLETPTNPLLKITDLADAAKHAHAHGAIVLVDNTFATPYLQQPLAHGADVVLHSLTKYLGGHSDLLGGALILDDDARAERYRYLMNATGPAPSAFDSFLVLRGLKTLHVRMDRHCDNAERLAAWLHEHPRVRRTYHPGLAEHPGHAVARRQMKRFGGMISADLDCGVDEAMRFVSATRVFQLAESLGSVESLIEHPASMTHASVPPEERAKAGFTDGLIRLSIGIEDVEDLQADLEAAFAAVF